MSAFRAVAHVGGPWKQDVQLALRKFRKSPATFAFAIITLALGIGANVAIFSVIDAVLLRQLPFRDSERIVAIEGVAVSSLPRASFYASSKSLRSFDQVAEYYAGGVNSGAAENVRRIADAEVSAAFFDTLGVKPVLGRSFLAEEDAPGRDMVALISHQLWMEAFHGSPSVLGERITLNGESYAILGVLAEGAEFPSATDVWTPTVFDSERHLREAGAFFVHQIARLAPGVSRPQATAELRSLAEQGASLGQPVAQASLPSVQSLRASLTKKIRPALLMLSAAVALVLLIACANIASLMLVRASSGRAELAVRLALGATRTQMVQQQLIEALLLSLLGAAAGVLVAHWAVDALYFLRPGNLQDFPHPAIRWAVLGFAAGVGVLTGLLCGLGPAWFVAGQDPAALMKWSSMSSSPRGRSFRHALVVLETALAVVLLASAGLLVRSMRNLSRVPLGYETRNLLTFSVSLHGPKYQAATAAASGTTTEQLASVRNFRNEALRNLADTTGVTGAAATSMLPMDTRADTIFAAAALGSQSAPTLATPRFIAGDYFTAMGVSLLQGRDFLPTDDNSKDHVAIVSQQLAHELWPGNRDPIGQRIGMRYIDEGATVIGVVDDVRQYGPREETYPAVYYPMRGSTSMTFVVRTQGGPALLATPARQAVALVDPAVPIFNIQTMQQRLADTNSLQSFEMVLLAAFAGMALLLSIIGLYGVIAFAVSERTREIGIRMALGANAAVILQNVLGEGLLLASSGAVLGIAVALAAAGILKSALFGVSQHDPLTLAFVAVVFIACGLVASAIPGFRAARVDPMLALRHE